MKHSLVQFSPQNGYSISEIDEQSESRKAFDSLENLIKNYSYLLKTPFISSLSREKCVFVKSYIHFLVVIIISPSPSLSNIMIYTLLLVGFTATSTTMKLKKFFAINLKEHFYFDSVQKKYRISLLSFSCLDLFFSRIIYLKWIQRPPNNQSNL